MRVLLFLNELSCPSAVDEASADAAMQEFVALVRHVRKKRKETALVTESPLPDQELAPNYRLQQWINKPANRDRWRLIQSARNRSPVSSVLPAADEVDYTHSGRRAVGLGGAHLCDGLAVSLPAEQTWCAPWISVSRCRTVEGHDGEVLLKEDEVDVRHASRYSDGQLHEEWISSCGVGDLGSGAELWEARKDFFPSLDFLPRVERDLAGLGVVEVRAVRDRLLEMEAAVAEWEPRDDFPEPHWRSHVTPESKTRKALCKFRDFDGQTRLFDMHARFTPGHGRVHFRLVPETGALTIAYIGTKLRS